MSSTTLRIFPESLSLFHNLFALDLYLTLVPYPLLSLEVYFF